jgi:hypothetical protein
MDHVGHSIERWAGNTFEKEPVDLERMKAERASAVPTISRCRERRTRELISDIISEKGDGQGTVIEWRQRRISARECGDGRAPFRFCPPPQSRTVIGGSLCTVGGSWLNLCSIACSDISATFQTWPHLSPFEKTDSSAQSATTASSRESKADRQAVYRGPAA